VSELEKEEKRKRTGREKNGIGEKLRGCHTVNCLNSQKLLTACKFSGRSFKKNTESSPKLKENIKNFGVVVAAKAPFVLGK